MQRSSLKIWSDAARPQTLAAAVVPVMAGSSLAYYDHALNWTATIIALLCAMLIQIGTNFANDYFDYKKGADTDQRIGFERATSKGLVSERLMLKATIATMGLAFLLGLYLVWHAGWVILFIGIISLVCGILYTGGPFPLGYNGLGDLFVFIFFGSVAVMGTYYVNVLSWSLASFWVSMPIGALATNILVVNNLRDVEQDGPAGKNTLGVLFGENALRWEYALMLLLSFGVLVYLHLAYSFGWFILIPVLTLPLAVILLYQICTVEEKRTLNKTLEQTAQFMSLFGILLSTALILSA